MNTANGALADLVFLVDVAASVEELAPIFCAPTMSPDMSLPQSIDMSHDAMALVSAFTHLMHGMLRRLLAPRIPIGIPVPEYSGHSDQVMTATYFLLVIEKYRRVTGLTEHETLERILPVALAGPAARWHRLVNDTATTIEEIATHLWQEFLPCDYLPRMRQELEERTQALAEPFVGYLRTIQEQ